MYNLPNDVKWIQGTWAGADKLFAKYNSEKKLPPYIITRFSGTNFQCMMAEYVITHIVSWERNFYHSRKQQEEQMWDKSGKISDYRIICDLKIGVLGIGTIGIHVASVLKQLGACEIWGLVTKIPDKKESCIDFYRTASEITEILENCDVIVNILPSTEKTTGLLNIKNLSFCKGAVFINVGRGTIVTEADLVSALNEKYLSGAVLDVFPEEPLPESSPLWKMEQVIITPHTAAITRAQDVAEVFSKHWKIWKDGGTVPYAIDFTRGY
ncbi:glyoxylate/hydroxypyruvate reductase A-like isoform X2 [Lycorma delicatula]